MAVAVVVEQPAILERLVTLDEPDQLAPRATLGEQARQATLDKLGRLDKLAMLVQGFRFMELIKVIICIGMRRRVIGQSDQRISHLDRMLDKLDKAHMRLRLDIKLAILHKEAVLLRLVRMLVF